MFGVRFWALSALCSAGAALLIGFPTVLIPNAWFVRMTPTSPEDYAIWTMSAVLLGPLVALAVLFPTATVHETLRHIGSGNVRAVAGAVLSVFSVGCPVCNKLVVLLLGVGGAMSIFNPLRPVLGLASIGVLGLTLYLRIRTLRSGCRIAPAVVQPDLVTPPSD